MDLPTALAAVIAVAVIAYIVTVVQAATARALAAAEGAERPEERLLSWPKWLTGLIGFAILIWFLYRVRQILLPFVLGALIAYILNPAIDRLEARHWSRTQAVAVVFGVFLLLFVLGVLLLVPAVVAEARAVIDNYTELVARAQQAITQAQGFAERVARLVGILPENVRQAFSRVGERLQQYGLGILEGGMSWLNRSVTVVALLIITPVVTFWVLRDYHVFGRRLLGAIPQRQRKSVVSVLQDINRVAGSYLLGMVIMVAAVAIYAVTVMEIARVPYAWLLGILTGVLYLIPYFGYPAAMVAIVITMLVTGRSAAAILTVLAILIAGNFFFDYVVSPRVLGRRVGLHPLTVIFAVLSAGALMGFLGVILAVPVAGSIRVVLLHFWPEAFGDLPAGSDQG